MADLAITAAQVLPVAGSTQLTYGLADAGATFTQGMLGWYDPSTQTWKVFDANDNTANQKAPRVCMVGASPGQPVVMAVGGDIVLGAGAAPAVGTTYVASATAGKICPAADLASGMVNAIVGVGKAGNKVSLILQNSGVAVP